MIDYRIGIRVERTMGIYFGLGITSFTERALVINFLFWEIYIGAIYDMGS